MCFTLREWTPEMDEALAAVKDELLQAVNAYITGTLQTYVVDEVSHAFLVYSILFQARNNQVYTQTIKLTDRIN